MADFGENDKKWQLFTENDLYFKLRKIVTYKSKVPVFGENAIEEVDLDLE